MATETYVALAEVTLASTATELIFTGFSQSYRDLVIVWDGAVTDADRAASFQLNGDTTSVYSRVSVANTSSSTNSGSACDFFYAAVGGAKATAILHLMDYSATDKFTTVLTRSGDSSYAFMMAGRYASTDAITSIKLLTTTTAYAASSSFTAGSSFKLFGIEA